MLTTTKDMILPTAITGSYPRPLWYEANLDGRSFKAMMGDSLFREQYLDAVGARFVRQHERRVQGAGGCRLPGDPGRGAAPSRADDIARLQGFRPRIPDRGVQPPAEGRQCGGVGAHLLGQPEPAAGLLGSAE